MLTLQVGQCGNQVGLELFSTLAQEIQNNGESEYSYKILNSFFRPSDEGEKAIARAVLVDMEPKVIQNCVSTAMNSGIWCYGENRQFSKQSGSANNWAYGYKNHGPSCKEEVENLIRKEVEMCDHLQGFLVTLSIAGGTGSGVGTYLTELVREQYQKSFITVQPVYPFQTGEVIVQNYNSILSLSHLYEAADALISMENDQLQLACNKLHNIKKVSFAEMNKVLVHHLAGALLPSTFSRSSILVDSLNHLCAHPSYKLLNVRTVPQMPLSAIPFNSYLWSGILKRLYQMLITDAKIEEGINWNIKIEGQSHSGITKSLANCLILRGSELDKALSDPVLKQFASKSIYSNWNDSTLLVGSSPSFKQYDKSATLLSNSQSVVKPLSKIVNKAYGMFLSKAYLYQYHKYQIYESDFEERIAQIETIIQDYQLL